LFRIVDVSTDRAGPRPYSAVMSVSLS